MERAKEHLGNGKTKIITAEEASIKYKQTISSKDAKFFCLCCGEQVAFVHRSNENYKHFFRHSKQFKNDNYCEKRINIIESKSVYEKLGLPLYLKKTSKLLYELKLGLHKAPEMLIDLFNNREEFITIKSFEGGKKLVRFDVNNSRVSANETTLLDINFISEKYKINYSSKELKEKLEMYWGEEVGGLTNYGAIFTLNNGRKLRINDEISFEQEYLMLTPKNVKNFSGVSIIEQIGALSINDSYKVYRFIVNKNKYYFNHLYDFFRVNFKLTLIYSPIKKMPLWPPTLFNDETYYVLNEKNILFNVESGDEKIDIFAYNGEDTESLPIELIDVKNSFVEFQNPNDKQLITLNEDYIPNHFYIDNYTGEIPEINQEFSLLDINDAPMMFGNHNNLPNNKTIQFKSQNRCKLIIENNYQIRALFKVKNSDGILIENLKYGDKIYLIKGIEKILLMKFVSINYESKIKNNYEKIYFHIKKMETEFVPLPVWVKRYLKYVPKTSKLFYLMKKYVHINKIPIHALNILKKETYKRRNYGRE